MTTALIVIDVQESFRVRDSWGDASAPDIADRIARLVDHSRAAGNEVVWVLHTEPGSGTSLSWPGRPVRCRAASPRSSRSRMSWHPDRMVRTVVFVVPSRVHMLDLAGPAQVYSTAADEGVPYRLVHVGATPTVQSHQGLPLQVGTEWPDLGPDDLVVVAGRRVGGDRPTHGLTTSLLTGIAEHHGRGGLVASVCSGAFALAEAGVLDGRRATTHHDVQDALARQYPSVTVVRDVLYVVDDRVATSAGIASGIDLALHLLAIAHGPALAARVARTLVVPARRNGSAPQDSVMLQHRDHLADIVHRVQDVIDSHFCEPLPLATLAAGAGVSDRTLTRLFVDAVGTTPLRYQQQLRVERARELTGHGWTWDAAAHEVGFTDGRMLRRLRA